MTFFSYKRWEGGGRGLRNIFLSEALRGLHSHALFKLRIPGWGLPLFTAKCSNKLYGCTNSPSSVQGYTQHGVTAPGLSCCCQICGPENIPS